MEELSKQYYKIKEVAEILDVPQSTLRFWEKEFPMIKPIRSSHNIRYYRQQDIELLRIIHYLIKDKGLKIEAAREQLRSNKHNVSRRVEIIDRLKSVRSELANLLVALGGRKL